MKVTFTMPDRTLLRTIGGKGVYLDWTKLPASVLPNILEAGAKIVLTNTFNSGGSEVTESARLAQMQKRIDAWERGDYAMKGGGSRDSLMGDMRDAFYLERGAQDHASRREVDKAIRNAVTEAFGEKEPATFGKFLDAVAAQLAKARNAPVDELRGKLQAKYEAKAHALRAEREKATAKIDVEGLLD